MSETPAERMVDRCLEVILFFPVSPVRLVHKNGKPQNKKNGKNKNKQRQNPLTSPVTSLMKLAAIGTLGLILAASISAQTTNPAKLKINGIGLDSTLAQVKKALGKPKLDGTPKEEGCIGAREKEVKYDGASFWFMDGDSKDRKTFELKAFEITSPKYVVSGIKVGDTEHNVRRRLGTKFEKTDDPETGADVWTYMFPDSGDPGSTSVHISRGKVIKISSAHMVC